MSLNSGIRNVLSNMSIIQNDINDLSNNDVSLQSNIDNKQDKITNNNYLEISDVSGLLQALENATVNLDESTDMFLGTIDSGNITGRLGTSIHSTNIIGTDIFYGPSTDLTNVEKK